MMIYMVESGMMDVLDYWEKVLVGVFCDMFFGVDGELDNQKL